MEMTKERYEENDWIIASSPEYIHAKGKREYIFGLADPILQQTAPIFPIFTLGMENDTDGSGSHAFRRNLSRMFDIWTRWQAEHC